MSESDTSAKDSPSLAYILVQTIQAHHVDHLQALTALLAAYCAVAETFPCCRQAAGVAAQRASIDLLDPSKSAFTGTHIH